MLIEIITIGSKTTMVSPYNRELVAEAKQIGGKWNPDAKAWVFDARDEQRVQDLARRHFGTDGTDTDLVDVRVPATPEPYQDADKVIVAGREVAKRRHRDSAPILADGVVIVSGRFSSSGGSMRYPKIEENDVILEVRGVPRALAEAEGMEIIETADERIAALKEERENLLARLAQIDQALENRAS